MTIEESLTFLQKNDPCTEILEQLGLVFKHYKVERLSELQTLKSEFDRCVDKVEKDRELHRSRFNESQVPPKELSVIVNRYKEFIKDHVSRGSGLQFEVSYKNLCTRVGCGRDEVQSLALVLVSGQQPFSAVFKIVYGRFVKYHSFLKSGVVVLEDFFNRYSEILVDKIIPEDRIKAMLVETGYKRLRSDKRRLDDRYVNVKESGDDLVITVEGYEELYDSWKAILNVSNFDQSTMKIKLEESLKIIKDLEGVVSGSLGFEGVDYYVRAETYYTPRLILNVDSLDLTLDEHHDTPRAWAVSFRFQLKFKIGVDAVKIKEAVDHLISASRVVRWGTPRVFDSSRGHGV